MAAMGSKPLKPSSWAVMVDVLWAAASVGLNYVAVFHWVVSLVAQIVLTLLRVGQFV